MQSDGPFCNLPQCDNTPGGSGSNNVALIACSAAAISVALLVVCLGTVVSFVGGEDEDIFPGRKLIGRNCVNLIVGWC